MNRTPLRRWLRANALNPRSKKPASVMALARTLKVSRNRAQFWVKRECLPRGRVLDKLIDLTGLPLKKLTPDEAVRRLRRLRERRRRRRVALLPSRRRGRRG